MNTKIYTYLKGNDEPVLTDFGSWFELKNSGWVFEMMKPKSNHVIMSRNGYINEFWSD